MKELAYVLIDPYTIRKSRLGGVIARYLSRTDLKLVAARMFGASQGLVEDYARAVMERTDSTPHIDRLLDAYIRKEYAPKKETGRPHRALCLLYSGETSNALSALQAIVDEDPSNAIAWANLGLVYEITGSTESARDAYTHAIEADPNDEAGAKSYASQRILQLNTAGSNSQGLSGTLRDLSGTNI